MERPWGKEEELVLAVGQVLFWWSHLANYTSIHMVQVTFAPIIQLRRCNDSWLYYGLCVACTPNPYWWYSKVSASIKLKRLILLCASLGWWYYWKILMKFCSSISHIRPTEWQMLSQFWFARQDAPAGALLPTSMPKQTLAIEEYEEWSEEVVGFLACGHLPASRYKAWDIRRTPAR